MTVRSLPWLTYFVAMMLFVPWPFWANLFMIGAFVHWRLNRPEAGEILRETFPDL
jgi:hypothetical protein